MYHVRSKLTLVDSTGAVTTQLLGNATPNYAYTPPLRLRGAVGAILRARCSGGSGQVSAETFAWSPDDQGYIGHTPGATGFFSVNDNIIGQGLNVNGAGGTPPLPWTGKVNRTAAVGRYLQLIPPANVGRFLMPFLIVVFTGSVTGGQDITGLEVELEASYMDMQDVPEMASAIVL